MLTAMTYLLLDVKIVSQMENDRTATQDRAQLTISSIKTILEVEAEVVDTHTTETNGEVTIAVRVEAAT